jgi:hypothetical protein
MPRPAAGRLGTCIAAPDRGAQGPPNANAVDA